MQGPSRMHGDDGDDGDVVGQINTNPRVLLNDAFTPIQQRESVFSNASRPLGMELQSLFRLTMPLHLLPTRQSHADEGCDWLFQPQRIGVQWRG